MFETGYRAYGSPSAMAPAGFEPATSRLRVGCSAELSYGARYVAGRDRTCGASRFRRALYRLSYGHMSRRGWPRTSDLLFVRQALVPTELLALVRIRDKGSNLDLQGQSLASCRLDDPGTKLRAGTPAPKRPPASRETRRAAWPSHAARCSSQRDASPAARSSRDPGGGSRPWRRRPRRGPSASSHRFAAGRR